MVLSPATVDAIKRHLAEGASQRWTAGEVEVSRGTVNAIAQGKRPDHQNKIVAPDGPIVAPSGPLDRCPTCGGMVRMPCLACSLRESK